MRERLVEIGRRFDARGWVPATSGNLSVRDGDGFWITASGRHKGRLSAEDFVRAKLDAEAVRGNAQVTDRGAEAARPSAETSIHAAVYQSLAEAQVVLHVHAVAGTLASLRASAAALLLPNVELLKAFGLGDAAPDVTVEVFDNHVAVPDIARDVARRLQAGPLDVPGFLIRGHGLTAWGASLDRAEHAVEAFESVFQLANAVS